VASSWQAAQKGETGHQSSDDVAIAVRAAGRGNPAINLGDGLEVPTSYVGSDRLKQLLEQDEAQPLAMVSGDFDDDGVPDLISGYATPGGGIITMHRGNVDSIYPNSLEARLRKKEGTFVDSPFLPTATVFNIPVTPDFLAAGNFTASPDLDFVAAARGSNALYLIHGIGRRGLSAIKEINVPGVVTALIAGEVNRTDGLTDLMVGIVAAGGPKLLIYQDTKGALGADPEEIPLLAVTASLALGQLDDSYPMDVAVAAGNEIVIVRGWDKTEQQDESPLTRINHYILPVAVRSVAIGNFAGDARADLAALCEDGTVRLLERSDTPALKNGKKARRIKRAIAGRRNGDTISWRESGAITIHESPQESEKQESEKAALQFIVCCHISGQARDDLVVGDRADNQLHLFGQQSDSGTQATGKEQRATDNRLVSLDVEGGPVAALPMRLNEDARSDLVILRAGHSKPAALVTTAVATFTVTNTNNSGAGSLRQAILNANANPGADTIGFNIPGGAIPTISPASALPDITESAVIDGTTQLAGLVELNGVGAGGAIGLTFSGGISDVRGMLIDHFGHGVVLSSDSNIVEGNSIDTNSGDGVIIASSGSILFPGTANNNLVGGTTAAARNVISGNNLKGVAMTVFGFGAPPTGNLVAGNYIGITTLGGAFGNSDAGVSIEVSSNNTIGGTTAGARNIISGNKIGVSSLGAMGNVVQGNLVLGNFIGTNIAGTAALPNTEAGVDIVLGDNNTIGGSAPGARHVISGNGEVGIAIGIRSLAGGNGNRIQGNYIGTNAAGTAALPNGSAGTFPLAAGVLIQGPSTSNMIGGANAGGGNLISGNNGFGIVVADDQASGNLVQGNLIGTNASGSAALANSSDGVLILAPGNTIGGILPAARNIISGNGGSGIKVLDILVDILFGNINNSGSETLQGNFIGTNLSGTAAIANAGDGVLISNTPNNNVGGAFFPQRNLISGNSGHGVEIVGANAKSNNVGSNYIGINDPGNAALGNGGRGIYINGAPMNTIGSIAFSSGNIISGNNSHGIELTGGANGNTVAGNFIGTDSTGTIAIGNAFVGALINGGANNIIGGTTDVTRNVISGNAIGIDIQAVSQGNSVWNNFIGLNASGSASIANTLDGVLVDGAPNNFIGGEAPSKRNIISGNNRHGVQIKAVGATGNYVLGNYIGTSTNGLTAIGNGADGVLILGASGNAIGASFPPNEGNTISGNIANGVEISGGTGSNVVEVNYIGLQPDGQTALGNGGSGVLISSSSGNRIGADINRIAFNGAGGVIVSSGTGNWIHANSIFSNTGLGIDLGNDGVTFNDQGDPDNGVNNLQNFPVITSITRSGGNITINGALNSTANADFIIDFFSNPGCDPSGNGQGQTFLGSTTITTNGSGNASFTYTVASSGGVVTATATDPALNTSEFSACASAPTAVEFAGLTATGYDSGVFIQWQTGLEVNNLGFNIYRVDNAGGKLSRVNSQLVAGSAFLVGSDVALRSGYSYQWWDSAIADYKNTRYWLEDVDTRGKSNWHGPFNVNQSFDRVLPSKVQQAKTLASLGSGQSASVPVESRAKLQIPASLQAPIVSSGNALKLSVKQEGWYRVTRQELVAAGLDPATDPRKLRLFVDGRELAISVTGQNDGRFDADDTVEFYGQGIDSPFSDARVYRLVAGLQPGLRVTNAQSQAPPTAGGSFAFAVERKDRSIYFAGLKNGEKENFFGPVLAQQPVDQSLNLPHVDSSSREPATLTVALQGVTTFSHVITVQLNGSDVGQLVFEGQTWKEIGISLPHSSLREGQNQVTLVTQGGPYDVSLADYVRLTYQHTLTADDDALRFTASAQQRATIWGFSNESIEIFDVTDPYLVQALSGQVEKRKSPDGKSAEFGMSLAVPGKGPEGSACCGEGALKARCETCC